MIDIAVQVNENDADIDVLKDIDDYVEVFKQYTVIDPLLEGFVKMYESDKLLPEVDNSYTMSNAKTTVQDISLNEKFDYNSSLNYNSKTSYNDWLIGASFIDPCKLLTRAIKVSADEKTIKHLANVCRYKKQGRQNFKDTFAELLMGIATNKKYECRFVWWFYELGKATMEIGDFPVITTYENRDITRDDLAFLLEKCPTVYELVGHMFELIDKDYSTIDEIGQQIIFMYEHGDEQRIYASINEHTTSSVLCKAIVEQNYDFASFLFDKRMYTLLDTMYAVSYKYTMRPKAIIEWLICEHVSIYDIAYYETAAMARAHVEDPNALLVYKTIMAYLRKYHHINPTMKGPNSETIMFAFAREAPCHAHDFPYNMLQYLIDLGLDATYKSNDGDIPINLLTDKITNDSLLRKVCEICHVDERLIRKRKQHEGVYDDRIMESLLHAIHCLDRQHDNGHSYPLS